MRKAMIILIEATKIVQTCGACPTMFEITDKDGLTLMFRLRYGHATLSCCDDDELIAIGGMEGFDGCCNWDEAEKWMYDKGIVIREVK